MVRSERVPRELAEPINEVLRITEWHDEVIHESGNWKLEFIARVRGVWTGAGGHSTVRGGNSCRRRGVRVRGAPILLRASSSATSRGRTAAVVFDGDCGNRQKVASLRGGGLREVW